MAGVFWGALHLLYFGEMAGAIVFWCVPCWGHTGGTSSSARVLLLSALSRWWENINRGACQPLRPVGSSSSSPALGQDFRAGPFIWSCPFKPWLFSSVPSAEASVPCPPLTRPPHCSSPYHLYLLSFSKWPLSIFWCAKAIQSALGFPLLFFTWSYCPLVEACLCLDCPLLAPLSKNPSSFRTWLWSCLTQQLPLNTLSPLWNSVLYNDPTTTCCLVLAGWSIGFSCPWGAYNLSYTWK